MKILQYILIIVLTLFIFFNLKIASGLILRGQKVLDSTDEFPGTPFLFLRPYLVNIHRLGYSADYSPPDPAIDAPYARALQTAEFALSPSFLDREHPWNYDYAIVYLFHPQSKATFIKHWPSRVIASNGFNIFLIERIKT